MTTPPTAGASASTSKVTVACTVASSLPFPLGKVCWLEKSVVPDQPAQPSRDGFTINDPLTTSPNPEEKEWFDNTSRSSMNVPRTVSVEGPRLKQNRGLGSPSSGTGL